MAIQKTITVDGIEVPFKASAAIPRMYRIKFRRDIYKDFAALQTSVKDGDEDSSEVRTAEGRLSQKGTRLPLARQADRPLRRMTHAKNAEGVWWTVPFFGIIFPNVDKGSNCRL